MQYPELKSKITTKIGVGIKSMHFSFKFSDFLYQSTISISNHNAKLQFKNALSINSGLNSKVMNPKMYT